MYFRIPLCSGYFFCWFCSLHHPNFIYRLCWYFGGLQRFVVFSRDEARLFLLESFSIYFINKSKRKTVLQSASEVWFVQTSSKFQAIALVIIYTWPFPMWSIYIFVFRRKPSGHADKEVMAAAVLTSLSTSPLVLYPSSAPTGNTTASMYSSLHILNLQLKLLHQILTRPLYYTNRGPSL